MKRRGYTLIATLLTVAIILILMVIFMQGGLKPTVQENAGVAARPDGMGTTIPGLATAQAQDDVCRANLRSVRQGLQLATIGSDEKPASIQDARIGEQFYRCPLGNEEYEFKSDTGEVKCPHPGHEKY